MTVLSRGARVRRGGRRPGWVLLTALLVLALAASSALVFTNRVELLKLAVILALWAAVAGAFVSVIYRRQSDADQSRVRDLKLVYDLQLDREISARREYELTVESQLRRELATELRAQAADDLAALRAELASLRTSLEILFDTDLEHRPALGSMDASMDALDASMDAQAPPARGYSDWDRNGENAAADWVSSDRVTSMRREESSDHTERSADESAIIDVPEEPLLPPRPRVRFHYEAPHEASYLPPQESSYAGSQEPSYPPPPESPFAGSPMQQPQPEPRFEPRHRTSPPAPPEPEPQPVMQDWQPMPDYGQWLPPGADGSHWAGDDTPTPPPTSSGRRRRSRHSSPEEFVDSAPIDAPAESEPPRQYGDPGRRSRSRHSAEYRDYGVRSFFPTDEAAAGSAHAPAAPPPASPPPPHALSPQDAGPPPPRLAPPPAPEHAPRHRGEEPLPEEVAETGDSARAEGQSVADLLARFQVQPSGGGRRRRRDS